MSDAVPPKPQSEEVRNEKAERRKVGERFSLVSLAPQLRSAFDGKRDAMKMKTPTKLLFLLVFWKTPKGGSDVYLSVHRSQLPFSVWRNFL
jgi:hypothetical protein